MIVLKPNGDAMIISALSNFVKYLMVFFFGLNFNDILKKSESSSSSSNFSELISLKSKRDLIISINTPASPTKGVKIRTLQFVYPLLFGVL